MLCFVKMSMPSMSTSDTTQHALPQQQQQQQQQQQEMLNQRLNAENRIYDNQNQNQNNQNTNLINQQHQNQTNSMHKNIGNNFNQKIINSNNNANVLLLPLQNAATLANLKKQRSLSRNSVFNSNSEINSVVVVGTTTSGGAAAGGSAVDANNTTNSLTTTTNQHNNSNKINNNINNHHNINNNNNNSNNNNNNNNNINSNNNNNNNNINSSSINSNNHYSNSNKNDVRTTKDDVDDLNTKNYMLVDTNNTNTSPSTILDFHRVPLKNTINNFSNATSSHLGAGVGANVVKFSGVPGDVVSDSTNSRRCCILM